MKQIMKEYISVKGSLKTILIIMLMFSVYFVINARIMIWIAEVINGAEVGNTNKINLYLGLLIAGCIVNTVLDFFISRLMKMNMSVVFTEFCNRFSEKVLYADYDVFTKYSSGKLNTVFAGILNISRAGKLVLNTFRSAVNILVLLISICIINTKLIAPIIVIYIIGAIVIKKIWNKISDIEKGIADTKVKRGDEIHKIIDGFAEIRSSGTELMHMNNIIDFNISIKSNLFRKIKTVAGSTVAFNVIDTTIMMIMVLYSVFAISNNIISSSIAMSLVMYGWRLLDPLITILDSTDMLAEINGDFVKYKEFMTIENSVIEGPIELTKFNTSIRFEDVSFCYEKSDKVLNKINLIIEKGQKVGFCGHSGGGKSTLIKLIPRLYDVTEGKILIDGINTKDLTFKSLRSHIGVVHQNNYIFKGSILYNVTYGINRDVTMDQVIEACKKCCIYDFIVSLPEGFNTDVGPNGLKLSGGQQQRIALTRIFLRDPDIIILDEATSALDNESEAIIQESLKMFADKTVITIAHRLSTIQDCDKIVVIDEHKIAEEGTHDELLTKHGLYYDLWNAKETL